MTIHLRAGRTYRAKLLVPMMFGTGVVELYLKERCSRFQVVSRTPKAAKLELVVVAVPSKDFRGEIPFVESVQEVANA